MKKLLLFDVDGTLLVSGGAGVRAMERAGKRVFGEAFDMSRVTFGGGLDPMLVNEALAGIGQVLTPETHQRFKHTYSAELSVELDDVGAEATALPGVMELLAALRASDRITIGLLTGNYQHTGCQKLTRVGIEPSWFEVSVWGDAAATRPGLVRHALETTGARAERTVVIGDTPRDVQCAKANGCLAFAVTTGFSSRDELLAAGADIIVERLTDSTPLWAWIES